MKNTEAYKYSIEQVRADERVIALMGEPIVEGWFISGSIVLEGSYGTADITIPVSGPKCSGSVISRAEKEMGVWDVYVLAVIPDCQTDPIVLIDKANGIEPSTPTKTK